MNHLILLMIHAITLKVATTMGLMHHTSGVVIVKVGWLLLLLNIIVSLAWRALRSIVCNVSSFYSLKLSILWVLAVVSPLELWNLLCGLLGKTSIILLMHILLLLWSSYQIGVTCIFRVCAHWAAAHVHIALVFVIIADVWLILDLLFIELTFWVILFL